MLDSSESLNLVLNKANLNEIPGNSKREKRKKKMKICITGIFSIKYPGHLYYKQKNSTLPTKRRSIQEDSSCILSIINSFFCQTKREGKKGSFQRSYSLLFHLIRSASHQLNNFVSCKPQKLLEVLTKTYSCGDSRVEKTEVTDGHLQERALSSQ